MTIIPLKSDDPVDLPQGGRSQLVLSVQRQLVSTWAQ
jgi:hypothetical protein